MHTRYAFFAPLFTCNFCVFPNEVTACRTPNLTGDTEV